MKISTKIRYGTRAILELADHFGEGPLELKEIATKEGISLKYLEQIIIPLRTAGLIKSIRGSKGGYTLAKPPSRICLSEVVGILDGTSNLTECLENPNVCKKAPVCVTRDVWKQISDAINEILKSITLEEMVNRRRAKEVPFPPMYEI